MPPESSKPTISDLVSIIGSVKTYLSFFVLIVLSVEGVLGVVVLNGQGQNQLVAMYGMLAVIAALIAVVSFFACWKPEVLTGGATSKVSAEALRLKKFCSQLTGHWWERIKPEVPLAISFMEIYPDIATNTVKMKGKTYDTEGKLAATWESTASCVNANDRKVFYYWQGRHVSRPNEPYEGFGEKSFHSNAGELDSGIGIFSDTNVTDMKSTMKKTVEFRRSTKPETKVMQGDNDNFIVEQVRKKLV